MSIDLAEDDGLCDTPGLRVDSLDAEFISAIATIGNKLPGSAVSLVPVDLDKFLEESDFYLAAVDAGAIQPVKFEGKRYVAISEEQLQKFLEYLSPDEVIALMKGDGFAQSA